MEFIFTPDEAQTTALAVAKHFRQRKYKVTYETPIADDAPLRPSLVAEATGLTTIVIEAQGTPTFGDAQRDLARWLGAKRMNYEFYLAASEDSTLAVGMLRAIKQEGVGLLLVDGVGDVTEGLQAANPALMVTPDPTLALGRCRTEVAGAIDKFNAGERKAGLGELCELVERETDTLARKAARKGWVIRTEEQVSKMNWATQIDVTASPNQQATGKQPLVSLSLKDDLHSFRGARNALDHKVRSRREAMQRERQFAERAMSAPRLVADLLALQRRLR